MFHPNYFPIAGTVDGDIVGDYGGSYALVSGTETGILRTVAGVEVGGVVAKRGTLTKTDFSGGLGVSSSDVPWNIWNSTTSGHQVEVNGSLYIRGAWWMIIGVAGVRGDSTQSRAICRKKRGT